MAVGDYNDFADQLKDLERTIRGLERSLSAAERQGDKTRMASISVQIEHHERTAQKFRDTLRKMRL